MDVNKNINKLKKYQLRNKLENILRRTNLQPCKNLQTHLQNLTSKIDNFYEGKNYQTKMINNSLHFLYSNHKDEEEYKRRKIKEFDNELHVDFSKEKNYAIKLLLNELSLNEIKIISRDIEFYIKDESLRELIGFFNEKSQLFQTLIFEEKIKKVENEDDRIKRLVRNKKNDLINRNNSENFNHFSYRKLNSNKHNKSLKEKIQNQKKLFQRKKFLTENHINVINNIISTSERDINNSNKFISRNNLEQIKLKESLKNINTVFGIKRKRVIKVNNNNYSTSKSNKHYFNSFSCDKINKEKDKNKIFNLKKFKKKLLEKESLNFINSYTSQIRKIFHEKTQSNNQLPKINKN